MYDIFLQILALYNCVDQVNIEKTVEFVSSLQQEDGSFQGDKWGKNEFGILSDDLF